MLKNSDNAPIIMTICKGGYFGTDLKEKMTLSESTENYASAPEESQVIQEPADASPSPSKHERIRTIASRTKARTRDVLSLPSTDVVQNKAPSSDQENDLLAEVAFKPCVTTERDSALDSDSSHGVTQRIASAKKMLLHPRRAMRQKATKATASRISSASKPEFQSRSQRDYLDAHDGLAMAESNAASTHVSDGTAESTDTDLKIARKRVEQYEDQRESIQTAWVMGRHVDRVRVVRWSIPKPSSKEYAIAASNADTLSEGKVDWPRYIARLLVYYSYGFTAPYIDDLETPPFDINDLTLLVERFLAVSSPWQNFFLSCRQVYAWESPRRTIKWAVLFWTLWYTNHIVGYCYLWVIYTTIRNRFYPSSVQGIRDSLARGIDRTEKAQTWSELISHHGRGKWLEPLLDELGPMIQLQLNDITDFLEVLANFYRWERPHNTAKTLFVFLILLLITLLCDMQTCIKLVWMFVGGGLFFTFPIAKHQPQYRKIVNLIGWFFWNIPNHAELGIMRLQEKALELEAKSIKVKHETSDYDTADSSPRQQRKSSTTYAFRAYNGRARGTLSINHSGLHWSPKSSSSPPTTIPFTHLQEMRKLEPSSQSKSTKMLRPGTEGLLFIYSTSNTGLASDHVAEDTENTEEIALHFKRKKRHEVFSLVLAWSGHRWQSLPIERHKDKVEQRETFDKALKRAMP